MQARTPVLILALLVLLAATVRLRDVDADALTSDEAFSWRIVQYPLDEMVGRAATDVHPPLYYVLLRPWLRLWGDSPLALRGLSILLGLLVLPAVCFMTREGALTFAPEAVVRRRGDPALVAGLLAAALVALHPTLVFASQNARMYSLSTLLAALSTGLLARALRTGRGYGLYGVATAAAWYGHYYSFFITLAQGLLVLTIETPRRRAALGRGGPSPLAGLVRSAATALVLFAPWLPVLWAQTRRVGANYWIPRLSPASVGEALLEWITGLPPTALAVWVPAVLALTLTLIVLAAWSSASRLTLFFLAQALLPWLVAIGVSLGPRSIFLPRYLIPTAVFGLALVATWLALIRAPLSRTLLALTLLTLTGWTLRLGLARLPHEPLAEQRAARFLAERLRPGDVVLTDSPRALNRMRYYLAQEGRRDAPVECLAAPSGADTGHFAHTASLAPGDVVTAAALDETRWTRLWWTTPTPTPVPLTATRWRIAAERAFSGIRLTRHIVVRYARADAPPAPEPRP